MLAVGWKYRISESATVVLGSVYIQKYWAAAHSILEWPLMMHQGSIT